MKSRFADFSYGEHFSKFDLDEYVKGFRAGATALGSSQKDTLVFLS